jgi:hypothetical protein
VVELLVDVVEVVAAAVEGEVAVVEAEEGAEVEDVVGVSKLAGGSLKRRSNDKATGRLEWIARRCAHEFRKSRGTAFSAAI